MHNRKYEVLDEYGIVLASNMDIEMTIVFIKGYEGTFYNEKLALTIREMDKSLGVESVVDE